MQNSIKLQKNAQRYLCTPFPHLIIKADEAIAESRGKYQNISSDTI